MSLQGFHLSQGPKKVTYVWADDESQRLDDELLIQSAKLDQAPGLDSDQPAEPPASYTGIGNYQPSAASSSEAKQEARRKTAEDDVQHDCRAHTSQLKQGCRQQQSEASKAVHVQQLRIDGLSEETITRMLAVHLRTRRRAESLIDRVQTLRTGCKELLNAMPQHVLAEA